MFDFLKAKHKSFLGIDIGTSSIKVVQLGLEENRVKLETYGLLETYGKVEILQGTLQTSSVNILGSQVTDLLKNLLEKSKVTVKDAILSVPVFSTFSAVMELPDMPYSEVEAAIPYEARQYIPIPISEVILGWNIIGKKNKESVEELGISSASKIEVLLVAIPKEVANKYAEIAQAANLNLKAIELESFAVTRALVGDDVTPTLIIDIGAKVTNILIADNSYVMINKGVDTSGNEITRSVSHGLNIDYKRAEIIKREKGLLIFDESDRAISQIMLPVVDLIANEAQRITDLYLHRSGKKVERVFLCGGSARLPGLIDHFSKKFNLPVVAGNPWNKIIYPPSLTPILKDLAPSFCVAIGLGMREL
jgi:type IV pilus assembly protein PilM